MKSVLIAFILLLTTVSCITTNAYCFNLEDYYPTIQGSNWTYQNRDTDANGNVSEYTENRYISGFEDVDYNGTVYSGFKTYEQNGSESKSSVQILTGNGLENVKSYWSSGIYSHYQLYGSSSSSSPTGPYVVLPRYFNINDIYEVSHRGYIYLTSGALENIADVTDRIEVMGLENVTLASGQSFEDCIKVKIIATENRTNLQINRETFSYVAEGIGIVKSDTSLNWTGMDGVTRFETYNNELLSKNTVPEPATMLLLPLGLAGFRFLKRRKR